MGQDTYVGVAPDGTGKKIRNLSMQVQQADGTISTVQVQVVSMVDEDGNAVRFTTDLDVQQQNLDELRALRLGMQEIVEWIKGSPETSQPVSSSTSARLLGKSDNGQSDSLIDQARDLRDDEPV